MERDLLSKYGMCAKRENIAVVRQDRINNVMDIHGGELGLGLAPSLHGCRCQCQMIRLTGGGLGTNLTPRDVECIEDATGWLHHPVVTGEDTLATLDCRSFSTVVAEEELDGVLREMSETEKERPQRGVHPTLRMRSLPLWLLTLFEPDTRDGGESVKRRHGSRERAELRLTSRPHQLCTGQPVGCVRTDCAQQVQQVTFAPTQERAPAFVLSVLQSDNEGLAAMAYLPESFDAHCKTDTVQRAACKWAACKTDSDGVFSRCRARCGAGGWMSC